MARTKAKKSGFWNLVDNFQGDKIIWMIVLLLIMISIVAISSSTPLLAIQMGSSRSAIMGEQLLVSGLGLVMIILLYNVKQIGIFRILSQLGYIISLFMLLCLFFKVKLPFMRAVTINGAVRALSIMGFQLHVFEFVKIFMIMYLAWAVNAYKTNGFKIANALAATDTFKFLGKDIWKKIIYIYFPILSVCLLVMNGSMSSTIFIGGIMVVTIIIGGVRISMKEIVAVVLAAFLVLAGGFGIYKASDGKMFQRFGTAMSRLDMFSEDPEAELITLKRGSVEFQEKLDKVRQPISAKVAVSEGGIFGKGPGGSTQRYIVPVMFEDYMFSFIIEEYGLFGAIIVLMLYCSLLARGSLIVRNCDNVFAKTAVAGLVFLISGQAFMHMLINVDLGPMTGQTLPMISHGNSSFLAFSAAFGIILSISRMAKKKIEKEMAHMDPIVEESDDIKAGLDDLEQIENL